LPEYRRAFVPGGTFFFTVVTHERRPLFSDEPARRLLRIAIEGVRRDLPLTVPGFVLLPDHLHCIWGLPENDCDFSTRWARIKKSFTQSWMAAGGEEGYVNPEKRRRHERGVWQRRFWEHAIRDAEDFRAHMGYIHYNPGKHGLVACPHTWPYSSFHKKAEEGLYEREWLCGCGGRIPKKPDFARLSVTALE